MPIQTEQLTIDDIEAKIRAREEKAHPVRDEIITAVIDERMSSGAGIHLENACPYFRTKEERNVCKPVDGSVCIGEKNYRKCPIYQGALNLEDPELFEPSTL